MAKYAVVRTDNMSGTVEPKHLVSLKYDGEIENGCVLSIGDFIDGEREAREGKAPDKAAKLGTFAIVANPEVVKSLSQNSLSEFINEDGELLRCYRITSKDIFGLTKEGFAEGDNPAVGNVVELNGTTKLHAVASATASTTTVGKIVLFEDPYYVVEVD